MLETYMPTKQYLDELAKAVAAELEITIKAKL